MKPLKIVISNLNNELYADGSRLLSSKLKQMGHSVRMIFMTQHARGPYADNLLDHFAELSQDADLVCLSFLSDNFTRAGAMTRYLAPKIKAPILWGGVHSTIEPEGSMEYVDILCRGEGDEALPEFVELYAAGEPYHKVKNFWFKKDGEIIRNPLRPLLQDLDSNPWPDYSNEDHFICDDHSLKAMTDELMCKYHNQAPMGFNHYCMLSSRGCAYYCAYCYNATYKEMFKGQRRLRYRSLPDVVDEIRTAIDRYPFLESFYLADDDFFLRPMAQLEEFTELLHEKMPDLLGRTFWGCNVTPRSLKKDKLKLLTSSGMHFITLGVQTGSERLNQEVYKRNFKNDLLIEKSTWIDEEFHKQLIVMMDIIVHGPYETKEDTYQTVNLMLRFPHWFVFTIYNYVHYPGAPIYYQALNDGLIQPGPQTYDNVTFLAAFNKGYSYTTHLVLLVGCAKNLIPKWILKIITSKPVRILGEMIPIKLLDRIPWPRLFFKLWRKNQEKAFKGQELKHN